MSVIAGESIRIELKHWLCVCVALNFLIAMLRRAFLCCDVLRM